MKKLFCLLFLLPLAAKATLVEGVLRDLNMQLLQTRITFTPTNATEAFPAYLENGPPTTITATNGVFAVVLNPGGYLVSFPLIPFRRPFTICVPDSTNAVSILTTLCDPRNALITTNIAYIYLFLGALGDECPTNNFNDKLTVAGSLTKTLVTNGNCISITLSNPASGSGATFNVTQFGMTAGSPGSTNILDGAKMTNIFISTSLHLTNDGSLFSELLTDNHGIFWRLTNGTFGQGWGINLTPYDNGKLNIYSAKHITLGTGNDTAAGSILQLGNTQASYDELNIQRNGNATSGTNPPSKLVYFTASTWTGSAADDTIFAMQNIPLSGVNGQGRVYFSKALNSANGAYASGKLAISDTIGEWNNLGSKWANLRVTNFVGIGVAAGSGTSDNTPDETGLAPLLDVASGTYPGFLLGGETSTGLRGNGTEKVAVMGFAPLNIADKAVLGFYHTTSGGNVVTGFKNTLMIGGGGTGLQGLNGIEFYSYATQGDTASTSPMGYVDSNGTHVRAGTSTTYPRIGGVLKVDTTISTNLGGGEDELFAYSVPANMLATDGDQIEFDVSGSFGGNAHSKRLRVYLGASQFTPGPTTCQNGSWRITGRFVRTAVGTATYIGQGEQCGVWLSSTVTGSSLTFSGALTFKVTGEDEDVSPSNASIIKRLITLEWHPAR